MSIDISGISNPVTDSSAYDSTAPGKWVDELSIFYLKIFKSIQVNNDGVLEDMSSVSSPLSMLENTLSGREEDSETGFSSWFSTIDGLTESLLSQLETVSPVAYSQLPDLVKAGLPAIPAGGGFIAQIVFIMAKIALNSLIDRLVNRIVDGDSGGAPADEISAIREIVEKAMLWGDGEVSEKIPFLQDVANAPIHITISKSGEIEDVSIAPVT